MNLVPHIGILIRHEVALDLLHAADEVTVLGDDAADEFDLPPQERPGAERFDDLRAERIARRQHGDLFRIEIKAEHVFPHRRRRFAKARVAFLGRVELEHVLLAPIGAVAFEIVRVFARLF